MSNRLSQLVQLNAKLNDVVQLRSTDDDEMEEQPGHVARNAAFVGGTGLLGVGYAKRAAVAQGAKRTGSYAKSVGKAASEPAKTALRVIGRRVKGVKFASQSPIVRLNAKLDSLIQFDDDDESHWLRNSALVGGAGYTASTGLGMYGAGLRATTGNTQVPMRPPGLWDTLKAGNAAQQAGVEAAGNTAAEAQASGMGIGRSVMAGLGPVARQHGADIATGAKAAGKGLLDAGRAGGSKILALLAKLKGAA